MVRLRRPLACLVMVAVSTGCEGKGTTGTPPPRELPAGTTPAGSIPTPTSPRTTADRRVGEASEKIGDAVDATLAAARAKRNEYAADARRQLLELDAKLAELNARVTTAAGDARIELQKKAAEAKVKRDAAAARLDELQADGGERWEKIKVGVSQALDDLRRAFE